MIWSGFSVPKAKMSSLLLRSKGQLRTLTKLFKPDIHYLFHNCRLPVHHNCVDRVSVQIGTPRIHTKAGLSPSLGIQGRWEPRMLDKVRVTDRDFRFNWGGRQGLKTCQTQNVTLARLGAS